MSAASILLRGSHTPNRRPLLAHTQSQTSKYSPGCKIHSMSELRVGRPPTGSTCKSGTKSVSDA